MSSHPAPCMTAPEIFQHPLVEDATGSGRAGQLEAHRLQARAIEQCGACPLAQRCLYSAVVEHDVAGVAGGTTQAQRARIRRLLGIELEAEDFGEFAGTTREGSRLSQDEVLRLRRAHPEASLETLAERLGCSLSTVKRHLRRARAQTTGTPSRAPRPTLQAVLSARSAVLGGTAGQRVA